MKWEIVGASGFATLDVTLEQGEVIYAQPKSMVRMTTGIAVTSEFGKFSGGNRISGALKGILAGESIALVVFTAKRDEQSLSLAPTTVGPVVPISLPNGRSLMIAKGSYLGHEVGIALEAIYSGVRGFLAKKGLFLLKAHGEGTLFLTAAGDIRTVELGVGERIVVDNDFVVAFDETVKFELVTAAKGLKDSLLSGEGLVNRYTGPGRVYYQSRAKARPGLLSSVVNTVT